MTSLRLVCAAPLLLLSACGSADDGGPAGLTPDEAQDINDAAVMLDNGAVNVDAVGTDTRLRKPR